MHPLSVIARSCGRKTHYTSGTYQRYFDSPYYLQQHPFDTEAHKTKSVLWIGEPGHSASIGALIWHMFGIDSNFTPEIVGLRFYFVKSAESADNRFVFAEVRSETEVFLCGGMTTFSGEGGGAYNDLREVFEFVAKTYNLEVETVHSDANYDALTLGITDIIAKQIAQTAHMEEIP
jgi:hypothetical protein